MQQAGYELQATFDIVYGYWFGVFGAAPRPVPPSEER
jgi:hypothetical protein